MYKYSFVIPVYNTEKYLEECVNSLLCQTYVNFNILLVDDGSTDNSGLICDQLAKSDARVNVMHISNGGPARIRNIGINSCDGDYIWFIDSDDRLSSNQILEDIDNLLAKYQSDMMFFLSAEYSDDFSKILKKQQKYLYDGYVDINGEALLCGLQKRNELISIATSPVNKLFKKEMLMQNKLYFVEKFRWHAEDEFLSKVIFYAKNFYFLNQEVYQVRIRPNSITTTVNTNILEKKLITRIDLVDICCHFFSTCDCEFELKKQMYSYYSYYYLFGMRDYFKLEKTVQRYNIRRYIKQNPFIFEVMCKTDSKNLKLLSVVYKLFGIKVMLMCVKRRYGK